MSRVLNVPEAVEALAKGQLVAIPTETVYGLAANALNDGAVARIYEAKGRPRFNPIICHVPDREAAFRYGKRNDVAEQLSVLWPGPLTLLLEHEGRIPSIVTAGSHLAGFRVPQHQLALDLLNEVEFPLAAPSANMSGRRSPTSAEMVLRQLGDRIAGVLDGGPCQVGVESTVVKVSDEELHILRPGATTREDFLNLGFAEEAIRDKYSLANVTTETVGWRARLGQFIARSGRREKGQAESDDDEESFESPGQMLQHYAPDIPLILLRNRPPVEKARKRTLLHLIRRYNVKQKPVCYLEFGSHLMPEWSDEAYNLSERGDYAEAARRLFSYFDTIHAAGYGVIVAALLPELGLGRAINDRLQRAASEVID